MTSTEPVRPTRQRRLVRSVLEASSEFRTASQVHAELAAAGNRVGLATVYRTLQLFADAGEIDSVMTPAGEAAYRVCSESHHHHLVCRQCGATVEVDGPAVERWAAAVAAAHGYSALHHTLELTGLCPDCT